ncbi:hypothetical protein L4C36_22750 [Photobacterium japonica]|uniref:hypothetical protein n=1 Tax=Photobacterium japonica TaxID=2910235 RepID=UPI003D10A470
MQDRNTDRFMDVMDFIIDAVAQSTSGKNTADLGYYLACLVVADHKKELSTHKMDILKELLERAEEIRGMG